MSKTKATSQTKQDQNGQLPKSNYLCNLLFEMAGVAILILQDGRIIDGNRQAAALLGVPQEELLGKTLLEYAPTTQPDGRDSAKSLQQYVDTVLDGDPVRFEWLVQHPNGEQAWTNMAWSQVELDGEQYLCVSLHDITPYKKREEMLREERNLLRFVVDSVPDHIYAKDTDGRFVFANLATAHSLGKDMPAEVVGKTDFDFSPVEFAKQFQADDQAFFTGDHSLLYKEDEILDKVTNETRWVASSKMLWRGEQDQILGLVGINHDITEQRQLADQIRQSLRRRERQVQTSTEIAQRIASAPNLNELFEQVVDLVQNRFEYYHAYVYTLEADTLVMQAGSGEIGQQLKARQYTIPLTAKKSLVAGAARSRQPVLLPDVSQETDWLPNDLIPQAQAELAVPIMLGEQVLGVLAVQSDTAGSLTEEDQLVLLGVCGQIAVFIENQQTQTEQEQTEAELEARVRELNNLQRLMSREGWQEFQAARDQAAQGYWFDQTTLQPIVGGNGEIITTTTERSALPIANSQALTKPLSVQGEVIGKIGVQADINQPLPLEDQELLEAVVEQVAEALERARLLEQTQKRAVELETVAQVSTEASITLDTAKLMQTVVDLTKASFDFYHVHIYLFDDARSLLVLTAGAGEIGAQMVAEGRIIPFNQEQSLVARAARERRGVIVNDVYTDPGFLPHPLLPDTRAEMAIPMIAAGNLLGVLDIQANHAHRFTEEDRRIQTTLAAQVAAALQSANLFEQTERALGETEILYHIGTQLNAITDIDEILPVITLHEIAPQVGSINLILFDTPERNQKVVWGELVAALIDGDVSEDILAVPVGTRLYLPDIPLARLWLSNPDDVTLISDIAHDERVDKELKEFCQQVQAKSTAIMPLTLGERWVGLINMIWTQPYQFTDRNRRLYRSIAGQAAVVINNWLLLRQTEERTTQLETLSKIETSLSQIENEADILTAIASTFGLMASDTLTLYYFDVDEQQHLKAGSPVAIWRDGAIQPDDPSLKQSYAIEFLPLSELWLQRPHEVLLVIDVEAEDRLSKNMRRMLRHLDIQSIVILPLFSGGRWQGLLSLSCPQAREFLPVEQVIFSEILDFITAVVTSRRAYLAQQAALAETEMLFKASQRINEAADLQGVLAAIVEGVPIPVVNRVVLAVFDYDSLGNVETMTITANWHSGEGSEPTPINTRYPQDIFKSISVLRTRDPLFLEDIQYDDRIDVMTLEVLKAQNILAMAILPLWTGNRQLGAILLEAEESYRFTRAEMRAYTSLAQQVAVTIDNRRLLLEAQAALDEVEKTQRRYTVQAWETYQAKRQTSEVEYVREDAVFNSEQTAIASEIVVPLQIRDEVIGILGLHEMDGSREWLPEELALIEVISREMAQAAENLRLLDETQLRAAREKRVNEISEKIQAAQTLEEALQIAVKEIGVSLNSPQTIVQLGIE